MSAGSPVTYYIDANEYVAANRRICFAQIGRPLVITLAVATILLLVLSAVSGTEFEILPIFFGAVAGAFWLLIYIVWLLPKRAHTMFREQVSLSEAMTLVLSDDGFEVAQESGVYRCAWVNIVKWSDDKDSILVYPTRFMMIWFPKSAIGTERIDFIRTRMAASGLPKPDKLRKLQNAAA